MSFASVADLKLPQVQFKAGDKVIEEGVEGRNIYILQSGGVVVTRSGQEICKIDNRGAVLGEVSILTGSPTIAQVTATSECSFLVIENAIEALQREPELAFHISRILAQRLSQTTALMIEMRGKLDAAQEKSFGSRFYRFMEVTNDFFDRDALHPFTKK
ncbi:MAG: hypothetical protein RL095_3028 [Verrucomicrobiota bacterium]|jgi:CRP-like cAMP-binding protein